MKKKRKHKKKHHPKSQPPKVLRPAVNPLQSNVELINRIKPVMEAAQRIKARQRERDSE
jgi:hypothetical protein